MITVLLVDDQTLIRSAVRALLAAAPNVEVVGEATTGIEAVEQAGRLKPAVVLMDIRMPVMDGIEATSRITSDPSTADSRVLILTTFEEDEYVFRALQAGASGFIGKGTEPDDLVRAVYTVSRGEALLSPPATRSLIDRYVVVGAATAKSDAVLEAVAQLTEREREILLLVAQGLSNDDIAHRLVISPLTAKTHVNRAMYKLAAHDRAQLVIAAYESGLLRPGAGG
jgi:DNA-binding NarL/FixJ family response regulator